VTIEQAIKTGIEFELDVRHVYSEAAKKFKDPVARRIFGVLADEEDRHVEYLEARLAEWELSGAVTAAVLETVIPSQEAIDAALGTLTKRMAEQDFGVELEMLKKALALEIEATTFFRQMVAELKDEEQKLFARFVEIEAGHEAIVQAEIDALTGLGFWFDYTEYRFDGA
jgi:rubrerythrin